MARYKLVVFSNCPDGAEEAFDRWYDQEHLPDVLAVSGFVSATRGRNAPGNVLADAAALVHRFLAIYEIESEDVGAALSELKARVEDGRIHLSPLLADVEAHLFRDI
jgi:hypothetical protein